MIPFFPSHSHPVARNIKSPRSSAFPKAQTESKVVNTLKPQIFRLTNPNPRPVLAKQPNPKTEIAECPHSKTHQPHHSNRKTLSEDPISPLYHNRTDIYPKSNHWTPCMPHIQLPNTPSAISTSVEYSNPFIYQPNLFTQGLCGLTPSYTYPTHQPNLFVNDLCQLQT